MGLGAGQDLRDEEGVSPVIGMILVLAISVVGIAAILYWGLPAIDEMKANVEYRSVSTQFSELDSTIRELVAGTTEKTAKRWEPSINRGEVGVYNNTEPWLYEAEFYNKTGIVAPADSKYTDFLWSDISDGDNWFNITSYGGSAAASDATHGFGNIKVEAYVITGTSTQSVVNVTLMGAPYPTAGSPHYPATKHLGDQMDGLTWTDALKWGNTTKLSFSLWKPNLNPTQAGYDPRLAMMNLTGQTFKIKIYSGSTLLAEAYYLSTSRVDYNLHTSLSDMGITLNNGGLITKQGGVSTMSNSPPIPPVSNTTGIPRFFARALQIQGNASFAGENRFALLVSLYSTTALASYDCVKSDLSDCAVETKIYAWGTQKDTWNKYLSSASQGYKFVKTPDSASAGNDYLVERDWAMAFTLLGSNVRLVSS